jgi:very-short-patch-repair endonuclease
MSKIDEYRENANECERMARMSTHPAEKALWLQMAQDWLRMAQANRTQSLKRFDAAEKARGTGQPQSTAEH